MDLIDNDDLGSNNEALSNGEVAIVVFVCIVAMVLWLLGVWKLIELFAQVVRTL